MRIGGKIGSMKEFQDAYFSAGTSLKRFGIAVGALVPTVMMLVFSIVWTGISGGFLFSVLKNGTENGSVWFPVLFVGAFVLTGIGLFSFGAYRVVSLIRTVAKAPPPGGVPVTSQTEISAGTEKSADAGNPFHTATKADTDLKETFGSKIFLFGFGFVFLCAGVTLSTIGVNKYLEEEQAAGTWISAPCKIVSAKLESRRGSKGGTTYSPEIVYEFSVAEKTYRGNDIFIALNTSSSDYDREKCRLEKYKKTEICWFNPENPKENALMKPTGGFSLRKMVVIIFGVPFVLIGGGILVGTFCRKRFKKKDTQSEPGALKTDAGDSRVGALVMCGFAAVWNLIVFVVSAGFFMDGSPGTFPSVVLGMLAVIGIGLIFGAVRACLGFFNPSYELMISPERMPMPGACMRLSWRVSRGDPAKVQMLQLEFVRLEQTGIYVNGKQKEKVAESVPVYETMSRTEIAAGTCEFCIPENLNSGKRAFRLSGKTAFFRPNVKIDFF